jgi:NAD(P)H dehydrogenase (quinone)
MCRILVLYDSNTGNVAQMAALVAEGAGAVPGTEVRLRSVDEATADDVLWCEGIAVGSPTNMGILSWKMKRFWDEPMRPHWMKIDGRIACAFSSAGGWGGGMELACQSILTVLMNFGFLVFGVTDYAAKTLTPHYGAVISRAPRDEDAQAACRLLGRRLAEWTAVFFHARKDLHPANHQELRLRPS